ncbi:MAG: hypothetical protein ABR86_08530, partial [Cryomorphaceae bacterium BACL23 MAG-120924-bin60]
AALHEGEPIAAQTWLFPEPIDSPSLPRWEAWVDILPRLGFQWSADGTEKTMVAGPYFLAASEAMAWLDSMLASDPGQEEEALTKAVHRWLEEWARQAPLPATADLRQILDELFACSNPWTNAQGKPIARILDGAALSAQFL